MKGARHKAQGTRYKGENTALFITIPVGASFACEKSKFEILVRNQRLLLQDSCRVGTAHQKFVYLLINILYPSSEAEGEAVWTGNDEISQAVVTIFYGTQYLRAQLLG